MNGNGLRILTETVTSPTLTAGINAVLKDFPGAKWHQYEVGGRHSAYQGAMLAFGRPVNTIYNFSQADVIVSIDADFLACGPGNLRHARQFADKRRVQSNVTHTPQPKEDWQEGYQEGSIRAAHQSIRAYMADNRGPVVLPAQVQAEGKPPSETTMNRLYVVEPSPSPTASMADHHFVLPAGEIEALGVRIWPRLSVWAGSPAERTKKSPPSRRICRPTRALVWWSPAIIKRRPFMPWRMP